MSSIIFVAIGQCGSQILDSFIQQELSLTRKFYPHLLTNNKISCIFVDTEPKVLNKIKNGSKYRKILNEENLIAGQNGRGSNWCYGYNGCTSASDLCSRVLERLRTEIERLQCFLGVVLLHSLGGGTGAGLGSRLAELVREEYPLQQVLSCVVAPSEAGGDSPLQHYNTCLSLVTLNRCVDGVLLLHNDALLAQLASPAAGASGPPVSMAAVNTLVAAQLGALLAPCASLYPGDAVLAGASIELNELLRSLCALPPCKLFRCASSAPSSGDEWMGAVKSASRQLKRAYGNLYDTVAAVCCYRGDVARNCHLPSIAILQASLRAQMHFVPWNEADAVDVWIGNQPTDDHGNRVAVAFNSGCVRTYLDHVLSRARAKYEAGAYLHWYYRHGGTRDTFIDCFQSIDGTIGDYGELVA